MPNRAGLGVVLSAAVIASSAEAQGAIVTVYRETFGTDVVTGGQQASQDSDWAIHLAANGSSTPTTHHANTASTPASINRNVGASKPGTSDPIGQVNAGPVVGATPAAYGQGVAFTTNVNPNALFWTPEYPTTSGTSAGIDPADYTPGSLGFSWYQGNASTAANWRVAVRVGGQWYASASTFANVGAVTAIGNFDNGDDNGDGDPAGHGAERKTLTYSADNDAWLLLNFDGTYDIGTNAATTGTVLGLGATPGADLSGPIDAFGLFSDTAGTGNRRFDTFTISGEPIPEPAALAMTALGLAPLLARRRRRRGA